MALWFSVSSAVVIVVVFLISREILIAAMFRLKTASESKAELNYIQELKGSMTLICFTCGIGEEGLLPWVLHNNTNMIEGKMQ
jgi:hypothetical protein